MTEGELAMANKIRQLDARIGKLEGNVITLLDSALKRIEDLEYDRDSRDEVKRQHIYHGIPIPRG